MKIGVMGAGGLGGFTGGRLTLEGHDVAFIAGGQHLEAIHQTGLRVQSPSGDFKIDSPKASDDPAEVGAVDLIFFCVKSYDATEAIEMMKPMVGLQTVVLPVLNGVEHIEHLADRLGEKHILGGLALMVANIVEPGLIRHYALNSIEFGEISGGISDRCRRIQEALAQEVIDIKVVPNVLERMWWKLAVICGAGR